MSGPAVVCVGLATLDSILVVPHAPAPDGQVVASDLVVAGGGPAATAAVTLARLGVDAALVGAVGDDAAGLTIRDGLEREGVDVDDVAVVEGARSPQSSILVDESSGARSIASYRGTIPPLELTARARQRCREAAWVHADDVGWDAVRDLRHDARLSVDGGNALRDLRLDGIALFAPTEGELLRLHPGRGLEGALRDVLAAGAETVVATRGREGSVAATADEIIFAPALCVDVVSTLGAGDVFHGALLAQLVQGIPLPSALARANACAALSCRGVDGRSAIPTAAELVRSVA